MVRCDDCGADVLAVWRHSERNDTMTHSSVDWICRTCHPGVHEPIERVGTDHRVVSDADPEVAAD